MAGPSIVAIMTRDVATATPSMPIRDALRLLEDLEIRHLPIEDDGRLVGIVSDRDLREYRLPLVEEMDDPEFADGLLDRPLSEAMSGNVVAVDSGEDLGAAIDAMLEYGVGAVPVVDEHTDALVGIVSYVDVLRALRAGL